MCSINLSPQIVKVESDYLHDMYGYICIRKPKEICFAYKVQSFARPEEYLIIQPKWTIKEIDVTSAQKIVAVAQQFVIPVLICHAALRISVVPLFSPLSRCVHVQPL